MNGIINVYKERGFTSHDVVAKLRGILHMKKIGHTGTLDPDATGVLPVCIGKATKVCGLLTDKDKTYRAVVKLGVITNTEDMTGEILAKSSSGNGQIRYGADVINRIIETTKPGGIKKLQDAVIKETINPMIHEMCRSIHSAIKINGKKLYELARQGKEVERKARKVTIYGIKVLSIDFSENEFTIEVSCSKGTYIRTLCKDIGEFLGCGAAMKTLVRTRVSEFFLEQALTLGQIEQAVKERKIQDYLIPIDAMFSDLKDCVVSDEALRLLLNGNCIARKDTSYQTPKDKEQVRMYSMENEFYAIYEYRQKEDKYFVVKMF